MSRLAAKKSESITVLPVMKTVRGLMPSRSKLSRAEAVAAKWIVLR